MKYVLMMNTMQAGAGVVGKGLSESGELVSTEGLAFPDQAKLVRAGKDGTPVTDGVFPESKEFLAE